jgi:phosphate:Na+ symporter
VFKVTILLFFIFTLINPCFASTKTFEEINWLNLIMGLFGGLTFFLYGMDIMGKSLKKMAGEKMRTFIGFISNNRFAGLGAGALVTMIIQSSSATTVMLVSFVQAGLMEFGQTLGFLLGAGIGTTVTGQLIAFKLTDYALIMVTIGFSVRFLSSKDHVKTVGNAILGFGILFFGMKLMSDTMRPLREYQDFINLIQQLHNPIMGVIVGAFITAIIQSSGAFAGILIVLAHEQLIDLEAAIPLIMGTNIGTCITAGLASVGMGRAAKKVALAHVTFKILGVLLFVAWVPQFAQAVRYLSAYFNSGSGRMVANAHTLFNLLIAMFFIPFTHIMLKFFDRILPEQIESHADEDDGLTDEEVIEREKELAPSIRHLDESVLSNPFAAIGLALAEVKQMVKLFEKMLEYVIIPLTEDEREFKDKKYPHLSIVEGIGIRENKIDYIEEKVSEYLVKLAQSEITDKESKIIFGMISMMNDLESSADIIEKKMVPLINKKKMLKRNFTDEGMDEIKSFHLKVSKQISRIKNALEERNPEMAKRSIQKMKSYMTLESEYRESHLIRLSKGLPQAIETHEIHMEIMDMLKQINVYSGSIAKELIKIL